MPRYLVLADTLIAHESRVVKAGEEIETEFPKVKNAKGELVEMRLGENLQLLKGKPSGKGQDGGDLV